MLQVLLYFFFSFLVFCFSLQTINNFFFAIVFNICKNQYSPKTLSRKMETDSSISVREQLGMLEIS